jgi:hypothetical protein
LYNIHTATGLAQRPMAVPTLVGVLGTALLFWLVVGAMKKTRSPALRGAE